MTYAAPRTDTAIIQTTYGPVRGTHCGPVAV